MVNCKQTKKKESKLKKSILSQEDPNKKIHPEKNVLTKSLCKNFIFIIC